MHVLPLGLFFQINQLSRSMISSNRYFNCDSSTLSHKFDHITPLLMSLHWLLIEQRIEFKLIHMVKQLHAFMIRHLRSILRITWQDKVSNKEILDRTGLHSMEDLLIRKNLRWTGHLTRMTSGRLPKQFLYCLLVIEREVAPVSGSRIPSRETWRWETSRPAHGHHSHSREMNGERRSNNESKLCCFATDSMMIMTSW